MTFSFREPSAIGEVRGRAERRTDIDALLPLLADARRSAHSFTERSELRPGQPIWLKGSPLRGKARWRHAVRQRLFLRELPRVREFANLRWLRARLFRAPEPLVAGWVAEQGCAVFQFLATAEEPEATPLPEIWPTLARAERERGAEELGREVARMHALGFVHRDLYVRNFLWTPPRAGRSLVLIDAWRGGPHALGRGPAYDLACLTLQGEHLFERDELRCMLDVYRAAGRLQGLRFAGLETGRFERAILRERGALVRQIERDPARARGLSPTANWRLPL